MDSLAICWLGCRFDRLVVMGKWPVEKAQAECLIMRLTMKNLATKFVFSKKAIKIEGIFTVDLTLTT